SDTDEEEYPRSSDDISEDENVLTLYPLVHLEEEETNADNAFDEQYIEQDNHEEGLLANEEEEYEEVYEQNMRLNASNAVKPSKVATGNLPRSEGVYSNDPIRTAKEASRLVFNVDNWYENVIISK
uniref:Uncharacterized protein n=1 Tax=Acrobeloides nanus TaxID=290746 RepID=A0A914D8N6_9BILA